MIQFPSVAQLNFGRQVTGAKPDWVNPDAIMSFDAINDRYWQIASIVRNSAGGLKRQTTSVGFAQKQDGSYQLFKASELRRTDKGLLNEVQRQNRALFNRDLTNAAWIKTGITALKDQAGAVIGEANAASSITATTSAATVTQTITFSSARSICSMYLKRLVGTGSVEITQDGTNWIPVTIDNTWQRFPMPAMIQANATIGVRLGVSGDSVAVDYAMVESGSGGPDVPSSAIECPSSTSITRQADRLRLRSSDWFPRSGSGTIKIRAIPGVDRFGALASSPARILQFSDGTSTRSLILSISSTNIVVQQSSSGGTINMSTPDMSVICIAYSWKNGLLKASINGADVLSATGYLEQNYNLITVGHDYNNNGTNSLWGYIEKMEVFADDPSDSVLKSRSVVS